MGPISIELTIVFTLITLIVSSSAAPHRESRQEESCHLRELDLCLASVMVFTQNSNDHPINNAEINRQCKVLNETESCLTSYTSRCMTENQADLIYLIVDGGLDTIRDLCKPSSKTRSLYLNHGDCINNQHKATRVCMRDFQASLEKAADIEWQDRLKLACCSFNKLNACTKDVIVPKCGSEAYELNRIFFRTTFSRLPTLACSKYDYSSKACAALLPAAGTIPKGSKSHSVLSKLFSTVTNT